MSLLESFYILFDSDSKDVKEGADKAKKSTDQLEKSLKTAETQSNKVGASLLNVAKQFSAAVLASASIGGILTGIKGAVDYAYQLGNASYYLGTSVEQLDAWGQAVEQSGGTAEGFISTLKGMTQALGEVDRNGFRPAALEFARFGIHVTDAKGKLKSAIDILPGIAKVFERMSTTRSFVLGKKLGLDEGTITLLQRGRQAVDEFIKRQKELGVITKQDTEIAYKFKQQWQDTTHSFRSVFLLVASSVLPIITSITKKFEEFAVFFRKHSDFIVGSLIALGGALLYIVTPAILSTIAAFGPFLLLAAGFALVYDDIQNFLKGNDSVLGLIVAKYPIVKDIIDQLATGFRVFTTDIIAGYKALAGILGGIAGDVELNWGSVFRFIKEGLDAIGKAYNVIKSVLGGQQEMDIPTVPIYAKGDRNLLVKKAQDAIGLASSTQVPSSISNSVLSSSNNNARNVTVSTGPITIQTQATDAQGIASDIGTSIEAQMRQALANYDDGLVA